MNDIKLLGRLTADPDVRSGAKGRSYALFTLAVPRRNKDDGADFVRCMAFDKLADALGKYCQKGRQLLLDGRLEVSTAAGAIAGTLSIAASTVHRQPRRLYARPPSQPSARPTSPATTTRPGLSAGPAGLPAAANVRSAASPNGCAAGGAKRAILAPGVY